MNVVRGTRNRSIVEHPESGSLFQHFAEIDKITAIKTEGFEKG